MRELIARRPCRASPRDAWDALLDIPTWLTALDSVEAVEVAQEVGPPARGRFDVLLSERLRLEWSVAELAPERRLAIAVRWRRLLRAEYAYEIAPHRDGSELVHTRAYRNLPSRALSTVWRAREEEELATVLREWCWEAGSISVRRRYAV